MLDDLSLSNELLNTRPMIVDVAPLTGGNVANDLADGIDDLIKELLNKAISTIKTVVNSIKSDLTSTIKSTVSTVVTEVKSTINSITSGIADAIRDVGRMIAGVIDEFTGWINGLIDGIYTLIDELRSSIQGIASNIAYAIRNAIMTVADKITDGIRRALSDVRDWVRDAIDAIREFFNRAIQSVSDWIGNVIQNVKDWFAGVIDHLKTVYEQTKKTVEDYLAQFLQFLLTQLDKFLTWWHTQVEPALRENLKGLLAFFLTLSGLSQDLLGWSGEDIEKILSGDFSPLKKGMANIGDKVGEILTHTPILAIIRLIAYLNNEVSLAFLPSQIAVSKRTEIELALNPAPSDLMINAWLDGKISDQELLDNFITGGISESRARAAMSGIRQLPTPGQVQDAFLRGEITLSEHDQYLRSMGFSERSIELIRSLYLIIPGPSDLIRMAVREAFTPDVAETFGQYEDFPQVFLEWANKIGLSEDWAKRYWAAHWDLPSPSMGFDMLHRGIIDENELKLLLRALDVMPFWREKLIKLSYNPLTRVDVRRMYQLGVINEDQVYRAYLDLGYDAEKAGWLTEFTKRYSTPEDDSELSQFRSLARSTYSQAYKKNIISEEEYREFLRNMRYADQDIDLLIQLDNFSKLDQKKLFNIDDYRKDVLKLTLTAYDRGILNVEDTRNALIDLGYDEDEITLELSISDYNRQLKLRNLIVDSVHDQYVTFIIDEVRVNELLAMFNFSSEEIERLFEEWNIERSLRTKHPSLTDLQRFYKAGLLTKQEFLDELRGLGYHEKYIALYDQYLQ